MQEECSDSPPQEWSSVRINISTLGLCLLIRAVISTHATPGRQALMMLVPPCPAKAFPQRCSSKAGACELWDETLTASESVAHVSFIYLFIFLILPRMKSGVSHQRAPQRVMASLVWSQTAQWKMKTKVFTTSRLEQTIYFSSHTEEKLSEMSSILCPLSPTQSV